MHQLYTLRGAQIRDAVAWWKALDDAITRFGGRTDVMFLQHTWPRWGGADIREMLANARDMYKYIHDEVLRMANQGMTPTEISEEIQLPPALDAQWYNRGYYGSLRHNAKAVYQRYLGWFDSHPAHLDPLPPVEVGSRYVAAMGGPDAVIALARTASDDGDYRWAAEVLTHVVFADPDNMEARLLQADVFEQLGYQSENGLWRSEYLLGAFELRHGVKDLGAVQLAGPDVIAAMTPSMLFDLAGIKLNGPKAWDRQLTIAWTISTEDAHDLYAVQLRNGVLIYTPGLSLESPDLVVDSSQPALAQLVLGTATPEQLAESGELTIAEGDVETMSEITELLEPFQFWFNIVTP